MNKILGLISLLAGIALALYGNSLNNSVSAQLNSLFSSGNVNPGNIWLYGGVALAVIGLVLLVIGKKQNTENN